MYDGEIRIDTRIDTTGLDKGVNEVQGKLNRSIKGLQSLMKGARLAAAFAALAKGVKAVAESTEALENSIRKASTLFGDVAVNVDNLRGKILQLSSSTGIAAEEIGGALYEALSSGVPATEDMAIAMDFLRSSAEAAKGGFADLEGTVTATAAVINAYGLAWEDAERVQGVLIQTQNKGMTTIGQLSNGLARVIPTAASFGVSLEQIGAALATTTAAGTQTDEAITGLNSLLAELGKQGQTGAKGLTEAAKAAGLGEKNFQDLIDEGWTIADILTLMSEYADKTDKTLIDMFGSIEAGRTALQLAGENAGRFADNLEAMNNTEGLVAAASAAVTTNTERLGTALRNAGSTIGTTFEPVVQDVAGLLANMVNAFFGNRSEADNLARELPNLKKAVEEYRDAQKGARDATNESTTAMQEQANWIALSDKIQDSLKDYAAALDELEGREQDLTEHNQLVEYYEKQLDDLANINHATREQLDEMYEAWRQGDTKAMREDDVEVYEANITALANLELRFKSLKTAASQTRGTIQQIEEDLFDIYLAGDDAIRAILSLDTEYGAVLENMAETYNRTFESVSTDAAKMELEELEAVAQDAANALAGGLLDEEGYARTTARLDAVKARIEELTGKPYVVEVEVETKTGGGGGQGPQFGSYTFNPLPEIPEKTIQDVMSGWNKSIGNNVTLSKIFGDDFDLIDEQIAATQSAIEELITSFDLDENSEEVKYLTGTLEGLKDMANGTTNELKKMGEELGAWAETAATGFVQSLGSGIESLITDFMTINEQVAALNEELGDAQAEQLERNQELAEAEEEYRLALLEGNQEEIDAALANLEAAEDTKKAQDEKVKSLKDEIKATQDGTKAWESFGKSALLALADVLEGLGAQLAAQAVAQAVAYNWVNAAIATAGSVAAYVAAGLVRGWAGSYAEGGIVPQVAGVPSTGDQHIARVNPGELILNEAQQENLASLLTAQEALLAYRESEDGKTSRQIVVELNGDVYGLDSEEVGRAVYRNIRSLQEEGRLDRWR